MNRLLSLPTTTAVAAGALAACLAGAVPAAATPTAATVAPGGYVGVAPTRAVDTRQTGGALGPGATRVVDLSSVVTSTTATAVVLNLTVTHPTAAGYLTVFPAGAARPTASSINKSAGETRSNSVTVRLPADGSRKVEVYNQAGSTQVVVDVDGYYDPAAATTGAEYFPSEQPSRALDTRDGDFLQIGDSVTVRQENPTLAAHRVSAVAVNLTAFFTNGPGFVTAWNGVGPQPGVSTLNYSAGSELVTPNFAIVPVVQAADGSISFTLQVNVAGTELVADVLGFYAAPATDGTLYVPVAPERQLDTRAGGALAQGPLRENETRTEALTGRPGGAVVAANLNVTAVDATHPTFLTVFSASGPKPFVSTLNPSDATAKANAVPVLLSGATEQEAYDVYNQQGSVDLVADLQGWFVRTA